MAQHIANEHSHDLIHIGEYARTLKKQLPAHYFKPVPTRVLGMIPYAALAIGGIFLLATVSLHWSLELVTALIIGLSFSGLGFLGHEILHGAVVKTAWLRNLLGQICFLSFWIGPKLWRKWHNVEHHGHAQHAEDDPDAMHMLEDFHDRPGLQLLYRITPPLRAILMAISLSVWFTWHSSNMYRRFRSEFPAKERIIVDLQYFLPIASWLALGFVIGWRAWVFAYLIPVLIANFTVMSYISTNHLINPLMPINDPIAGSLSVKTPRWVNVIHFNFSYHTEHHVFPAMNPKYAPHVKQKCKELWPERYNEMPHWEALMLVCLTPRLYVQYHQLLDPVRKLVYPVLGHGLRSGEKLKAKPYAEEGNRP